jgi:hypothetical protein
MDQALREVVAQLRHAFPDGVPPDDYMALLAVLGEDMSEENVAVVVAELIDGETVVVANDAAAAQSVRAPKAAASARVRSVLESVGWRPDPDLSARILAPHCGLAPGGVTRAVFAAQRVGPSRRKSSNACGSELCRMAEPGMLTRPVQ